MIVVIDVVIVSSSHQLNEATLIRNMNPVHVEQLQKLKLKTYSYKISCSGLINLPVTAITVKGGNCHLLLLSNKLEPW